MTTSNQPATPPAPEQTSDTAPESKRELSSAAKRALAEAEARHAACNEATKQPPEHHGRGGLEPVRYGDWEVKGIAVDF